MPRGQKDLKILGGKGANLAEMCNLSIPVPPGFTISTKVCTYYMKTQKYPPGFQKQVNKAIQKIENEVNKKFGDVENLSAFSKIRCAQVYAWHDGDCVKCWID